MAVMEIFDIGGTWPKVSLIRKEAKRPEWLGRRDLTDSSRAVMLLCVTVCLGKIRLKGRATASTASRIVSSKEDQN